jgi:hypothetical protein
MESTTGKFVYVPIPESKAVRNGMERPYALVAASVRTLGVELPLALSNQNMHLDPDFSHLTYGDQGERAKQIRAKIDKGDLLVFYAGLADINPASRLVYAIIGLYVIAEVVAAIGVPRARWDENAHTRRILPPDSNDIVVRAQPAISGRLERCIPIGAFRNGAYRVTQPTLAQWGGISVLNGYLQRSARLPEFLNAAKFYEWLTAQEPTLVARNW